MSDDVLIRVEGVSKKFCRHFKKSLWYGVKDTVADLVGRPNSSSLRSDEFWAVDDVSFELRRGECLGLIGRNGAGKTTLLKMLNGLIKPDKGRIQMRGRLAAIIALGAGFNPILTGRENIYVNASILGLRKRETDQKFDEIVDFAEICEFIDTPVQSYSSGMLVRLGFAVATALNPDVLLLDEVLAVGDAAFRMKCHSRLSQIRREAAVVFVSHDLPHVARTCDRTLVLTKGCVVFEGSLGCGIEVYRSLNEDGKSMEEGFLIHHAPIRFFEVETLTNDVPFNAPFRFDMTIDSARRVRPVVLRINIYNQAGLHAADCVIESEGIEHGRTRSRIEVSSLPLKAGRYQLSVSIVAADGDFLAASHKRHEILVTGGHPGTVADCQLHLRSWINLGDSDQGWESHRTAPEAGASPSDDCVPRDL